MPYIVLFILPIRGVTLPGSVAGMEYYLKPEWHMLKKPGVSHSIIVYWMEWVELYNIELINTNKYYIIDWFLFTDIICNININGKRSF